MVSAGPAGGLQIGHRKVRVGRRLRRGKALAKLPRALLRLWFLMQPRIGDAARIEHHSPGNHLAAADFLLIDYQVKAQYLTEHFGRMWTRFNFFLTIESAMFALSLNADFQLYGTLLTGAGLAIAVAW